jgi:K+ transporter
VMPLTLVILFGLFAVQKKGTSGLGKFFGPITLVWFGAIALLGVIHIASNPAILLAVSPHYAVGFAFDNPHVTFIILGAVVLCVTGGEALYADMGHFGKKPIRVAWFTVVMPALTLNYFGQHDGPRLGFAAFGCLGHHGSCDCLPSLDIGRILGHQTSDSAGILAAAEHRAHQCA